MAKSDNYINAANSIVCVVGTAAAETVTGGAGTAISGVASLNELRKRIFAKTPEINAAIAADIKAALEKPVKPLPAEAELHIPQMIAKARLQPAEIMACKRTPSDICTAMLGQMTDREHLDREMQAAFREVVAPILEARLNNPQTNDTLRPAFETAVAETMGYIAEKVDLLASEMSEHAQARGIAEGYLIGLARQIAPAVEDVDTAQRELQNAIAVAGNMKERAALSSNVDDGVQQIMQEVEALNEAQQMHRARDRLNEALAASADEQERQAAAHLRLLDAAIDQAVLTRSVEDAVRHTLDKLEQEVPDEGARFGALWAIRLEWYERGRDKGLGFDLEVSIALAKASRSIADGPDQVGKALNDLGTAQQTLGERESGTARLEQAVAAYEAALLERTRERVPLDWAMTQNNLGAALQTLGERKTGTARLEQAVAAYEAALLERMRERVPLDWAGTQNNLGNVLRALGERESGTARLEQALAAYEAALWERTRERVPLNWASTRGNQATALFVLGERSGDVARLDEAIAIMVEVEAFLRDGGHIAGADMFKDNIALAQKRKAAMLGEDGG